MACCLTSPVFIGIRADDLSPGSEHPQAVGWTNEPRMRRMSEEGRVFSPQVVGCELEATTSTSAVNGLWANPDLHCPARRPLPANDRYFAAAVM